MPLGVYEFLMHGEGLDSLGIMSYSGSREGLDSLGNSSILSRWRYEPRVRSRSELLEERRAERLKTKGLETPIVSFAHVNKLERDCMQTSGSFFSISEANDSRNGPSTLSELREKRREDRAVAEEKRYSLTLASKAKERPSAEELTLWWTKMRDYVEDTSEIEASARLNWNAARKRSLPVDPMKERCPAAIMERLRLWEGKNAFAEKVTHDSRVEERSSRSSRRCRKSQVQSVHPSNILKDGYRNHLAGRKLYIQSIAQRQLLNERIHDQLNNKSTQEFQRIERPQSVGIDPRIELTQTIRCRGFINA